MSCFMLERVCLCVCPCACFGMQSEACFILSWSDLASKCCIPAAFKTENLMFCGNFTQSFCDSSRWSTLCWGICYFSQCECCKQAHIFDSEQYLFFLLSFFCFSLLSGSFPHLSVHAGFDGCSHKRFGLNHKNVINWSVFSTSCVRSENSVLQ